MSATKGSKTSGVKTWKLEHGPFFVEVTTNLGTDKPKAKMTTSSRANGKAVKRKK